MVLGGVVAGEPDGAWLEVSATPDPARLHPHGRTADVALSLELINRAERRTRVAGVTVVFSADGRELERSELPRSFFKDPVFPRPNRLDPGHAVEWGGICLDGVPADADRVRFELELIAKQGLRKTTAREVVDVSLEPTPDPVALRLPFRGYWRVFQGHGCATNHRTGGYGGDFAWDFAALGPEGRGGRPDYSESPHNRDWYSFGAPVLAPADGRVVRVVNDVADNEGLETFPRRSLLDSLRTPEWIFGNFVVIDLGSGAFVLMSHLKHGSVRVKVGDRVSLGRHVADCGNSGNTIDSHLHVQVMDRADPTDPEVRGLPARFVDYLQFSVVSDGDHRDLLAERIESGDPPEWAVIAPGGQARSGEPDGSP